MIITSAPNTEYPGKDHEHLWLLVDGGDYHNEGIAYYIGSDRDIEGDDIATGELDQMLTRLSDKGIDLDRQLAHQALAKYRDSRSGT